MKIIFLIFSILLTINIKGKTSKTVTIIGELKGCKKPTEVYFIKSPVYDFASNQDTTLTNNIGQFTVTYKLDKPGFFTFYSSQATGDYESPIMFVQPGKEYHVISQLNDHGAAQIIGPNCEGLALIQTIDNYKRGNAFAELWNLDAPENLLDTLQARIKRVNSRFLELFEKNKIDSVFYAYSQTYTRFYYAYQLGETINYAIYRGIKKVDHSKLIKINNELFNQNPLKGNQIEYSSVFYYYVEMYLLHHAKEIEDVYNQLSTNGLLITHLLKNAKNQISDEAYKFYAIKDIWSNAGSLNEEIIDLFDQYKKDYPKDLNNKYFQILKNEKIPVLRKMFIMTNNPMPADVKFIDTAKPIISLDGIVSQFKGKTVLIDCWATWCGGCIAQFNYKKSLDSFLMKNGIDLVYIAFEYNLDRERWNNCISKFDLSGNHILINNSLKEDISRKIGTPLGLPIYLLIDKNGILRKLEHGPRDQETFFGEIKSFIQI